MATGLFALWRRPRNHTGLLMYAVGATFLLTALKEANAPAAFDVGLLFANLFIAVVAHLLVAFPTGRLEGRVERRLVGVFYASAVVLSVAPVLFKRSCGCTTPHPRNVFLVAEAPAIATALEVVAAIGLIVAAIGIAVLLVRRWRASSGAQRRIIAPVLWTGAALVAALSLLVLLQLTSAPKAAQNVMTAVSALTIAAVPFAFLAGLLRMRYTRADIVGDLVRRLQSTGSSIREAIATALGDPSLQLVYWRARTGAYVTADGQPARLPADGEGRAFVEIAREGEPVAAMIFDATLADEPELISAVSSAGALALDNERLQAELRARITELEDSRARVLDAELSERRRIERDLHDGAQQRFVSLSMTLALLDRGLAGAAGRAPAAGLGAGAARPRAGRAAGARARDPSGPADRARAGAGDRGSGGACPARRPRARGTSRAAAGTGRDRRVLHRVRIADERRQARERGRGHGPHRARERDGGRRGERRRRRRRRSHARLGAARARRSPRRARRCARGRESRRRWHPRAGEDPVRVVIGEDSLLLREGLARLLEETGHDVVAQAGDAEELLRKVGAHKPDLAIVDVRMPPSFTDEGIRAALTIRERWPQIAVLVLSEHVESTYALELFADGTDGLGYLLKQRVSDLDEFADAVSRVAAGGSALDPEVVSHLLGRHRRGDPLDRLTPREREVLGLMAEGRSNHAIAEQLVITERAVEKHVTSIFSKLDLPPTAEAHRRVLAVLKYLEAPATPH